MHHTRPYLAQLPPTYLFLHAAVSFVVVLVHCIVYVFCVCLVCIAVFVFASFPLCLGLRLCSSMTYKQRATCWSTMRCKFPLTLPFKNAASPGFTVRLWPKGVARLWPTLVVVAATKTDLADLLKANVVA